MADDSQHDATSELNEALTAGFAARNFEGLGPFYTEDASLLPPRGQVRTGRAEASAFWLSVANRFSGAQFTTAATKPLGDAARRESGTYTMSTPDGATVAGKYVFVWQLVDAEWQIESAIWNRSPDNAGAGAPGQRADQGRGQNVGQGPRPGYRQGGGDGRQGGGYRAPGQGGGYGGGGGYRQGGRRPSFQQGGAGIGGGRAQGGPGRQGGPGQGQGGRGQGGRGQGQGGGNDGSYEGGLYSGPKD